MADILDLDIRGEDMAIDDGGLEDDPTRIVEQLKAKVLKRKGRGFVTETSREIREDYEEIEHRPGIDDVVDVSAQRSVEGWILTVTGINEEAHEDDVQGRFAEYGEIRNLHLNLDRRTGFLKGYALVEYEHFKEAQAAKLALDGADLLGNVLKVEWAFLKRSFCHQNRSRRRH